MRSCRQYGAKVAEIREARANNAIFKLRSDNPSFIIAAGNDEEKEGTWVWPSDGKVFFRHGSVGSEYHNWAMPEDDPDPAINDKLNCMVMIQGGNEGGKWRDGPCGKKSVVCEAPVAMGEAVYLEELPSSE